MQFFLRDILIGLRVLARSPWTSLWVILTLALGIGVNSAIYSVVDARLLHPVDYAEPQNLVMLWERDSQGARYGASPANFLDWRAQARSFSGSASNSNSAAGNNIAGWASAQYVMTGLDRPLQLSGARVTANFLNTLGVQPPLGRGFAAGEDTAGSGPNAGKDAAHVAVISYQLWTDSFAASSSVLQRTIQLNGVTHAIIGVLPADFQFLDRRQVLVPIALDSGERDYRGVITVARLTGERSTAAAEMATISAALDQQYPSSNRGWKIDVQNLLEAVVDPNFRLRLLMLLGAVGMVLLIACANIAGLLLTRAIARSREMAIRVALGAPQARLVRQLLTEYFLLAMAGALVGLVLGALLIRLAPAVVPANLLSTATPITPNPRVILFALALSLGAGLLFGLVPALAGARQDVVTVLRGGRGSTASGNTQRFRRLMVMFQVAVALMLLASSALMSQSLANMMLVNPGFNAKNTLAAPLVLPPAQFDAPRVLAYQKDLLDRVRQLPGVQDAALASDLPLYNNTMDVPFELEDAPPRAQAERPGVRYTSVTPEYFRTLQITQRAGRGFEPTDQEPSPPVVIVNQAFADQYFPRQDPIGKGLTVNRPLLDKKSFGPDLRVKIVGVVTNVRLGSTTPGPVPVVYAPQAQNVWAERFWLVLRTSETGAANTVALTTALRGTVAQLDSGQTLGEITRLETRFAVQFSQPKFQMLLMSAFAGMALLLAVIGIYGVGSHTVAQRRSEIGLRMALGASPSAVMRNVLGQGVRLTAMGLVMGLAGALAVSTILRTLLVGVSATDPLVLLGTAAFLLLISAAATLFPALRAMRLDPALALRQE